MDQLLETTIIKLIIPSCVYANIPIRTGQGHYICGSVDNVEDKYDSWQITMIY